MSETRQWVERFEALRDDLATGDLYHVQKWVQNDGALTEIAEGIARLTAELEEARERERGYREALERVADGGCERVYNGDCWTAGYDPDAEEYADRVCDPCFTHRALAVTPPAEGGGDAD